MGGGGKSGGSVDRSAELYAQQQADLARQRQEQADKETAAREAEKALQDELRASMLGQRNMLSSSGEQEGTTVQNTLG